MMMVVMMRAQIFFKDMFVFSGTSVWYVFSTMEPNSLHTRYIRKFKKMAGQNTFLNLLLNDRRTLGNKNENVVRF
jgi:hypothetical protein